MPTYEYECTCCSSRFELKQSFSENAPVPCPDCGGATQRIFSPVPIIFKGSGFYVTDSRTNNGHSPHKSSTSKTKAARTDETEIGTASETKTGSTDETKAGSTNETKAGSTEGK
ncbi:FmdB family zinc ribbon protein [Chloroflexota bacterium]